MVAAEVALGLAMLHGWTAVYIEGDCLEVTKALNGQTCSWKSESLRDYVVKLSSNFAFCKFKWINRRSNGEAHLLAQWAFHKQQMDQLPLCILQDKLIPVLVLSAERHQSVTAAQDSHNDVLIGWPEWAGNGGRSGGRSSGRGNYGRGGSRGRGGFAATMDSGASGVDCGSVPTLSDVQLQQLLKKYLSPNTWIDVVSEFGGAKDVGGTGVSGDGVVDMGGAPSGSVVSASAGLGGAVTYRDGLMAPPSPSTMMVGEVPCDTTTFLHLRGSPEILEAGDTTAPLPNNEELAGFFGSFGDTGVLYGDKAKDWKGMFDCWLRWDWADV
ncbi:hypothetical protein IFM89_029306 [Coptis chinensis]|uniref:RNase H type-1 domain-containing protein n=1 Tax=Coptis chinensis TaxID=261450 RepID=A0A835ITJ4_9MAGN|nr:hypothetical protein IFM89_029306 [Coptis chinensis]